MSARKISSFGQNRFSNCGFSFTLVLIAFLSIKFILAYTALANRSKVEPTLKFVSLVHRHGERSPYISLRKGCYDNNSVWPAGLRQLTKKGTANLFKSGQMLRDRYDGFLPKEYRASDIYVRSSDIDRTIMSAQALLAGLYPPVENQIWNPKLLWQPIPVHSIPDSLDNMIRVVKPCPLLTAEEVRIENELSKKLVEENKDLIEYLKNATDMEAKTALDMYRIYDYILVLVNHGLSIPEWATNDVQEKLYQISKVYFQAYGSSKTALKLQSGVLINDIIENMKKKATSGDTFGLRMNIYSGHETTLYPLWHGLGVAQEAPVPPGLGATMVFELHEINNKYFVKVLYKNYGSERELSVLHIKGCGEENSGAQMCDLDDFARVLEPATVKNFQTECQIPTSKTN